MIEKNKTIMVTIVSSAVLMVLMSQAASSTSMVRSAYAANPDCNAPSVAVGTDPKTGQDMTVTRCQAASTDQNNLRDFNIGRADSNGQTSSARGGDNAGGYPSRDGSRCAIAEMASFDQAGCYP